MELEEQSKIEETVDNVKDYLNTRYELTILKGADKISHIGSNVLSFIPLFFLTALTIVLLSVALALYLNVEMQSNYLGFLVVGGAYLVILLVLFLIRKSSIAKPLRNRIIQELFKTHNL